MAIKVTIVSLIVVLAAATLPGIASRVARPSSALARPIAADANVGRPSATPASVIEPGHVEASATVSSPACIVDGPAGTECAGPAARWTSSDGIEVCITPAASVATGELRFQDYVLEGIEAWNQASAGVVIRYAGQCEEEQGLEGDSVNEIGFDDTGILVQPELAVTQATVLLPAGSAASSTILEADVFLSRQLLQAPACLQSAITHELGHLLGLGHSDYSDDIMFATIALADPTTCTTTPSGDDSARLRALYADVAP